MLMQDQIKEAEDKRIDIEFLAKMMEEIANLPKEGPIVRQPGEKCSYELS